jgi:hypothetical protein
VSACGGRWAEVLLSSGDAVAALQSVHLLLLLAAAVATFSPD